jgi:iron complex outermembrane receptor protein
MSHAVKALVVGFAITLCATSAGAAELDEVVVTASKREQNLLDVPASISAIAGDAVRELGARDIVALASQIPGLQIQEYDLFPAFFMRGAGVVTETNDLNDQPVGTYLDEVYLGAPSLSRGLLFDVERIEVLRGPQGTLFGRNTSAGLVHYITKAPTETVDGYAQVGFGSFGQQQAEAALGGPITDRLRGRLSAKWLSDDGWQRDRLTGVKFNKNDQQALRGQLEYDVTDALLLSAKFEYANQNNSGQRLGFSGLLDPANPAIGCSPDRVNAQACVASNGYRDPTFDPAIIATDDAPLNDLTTRGYTVKLVYSGSSLDFTSITAYRDLTRAWVADGDATPLPFFGGAIRFSTFRTTDANQFSQEFRVNGKSDRLNWVAGAYYFEDERDFLTSFPNLLGGNRTVSNLQAESLAAFGQLDFELTDKWTAVVGLRQTKEDREIAQVLTPMLTAPAVTVQDTGATTDRDTSGRVAIEWHPRENALLYASYATGFKSGTFAQTLNATRGIDQVDPEKSRTLELGYKGRFWDSRGQLTVALYDNRYRDYQATGSETDPATGVQFNRLNNVGQMKAQGLEAELSLAPAENWLLNLGLTLTDTEISSTQNSGERDIQTNQLLFYDGNPAPSTPKSRVNGSVRWTIPAASAGEFGALLAFNWQDDITLQPNANRYHRQSAYETVDLTILWKSPSERYFAQIAGNNLTDQKVAGWQYSIGFVGIRATAWALPPRAYSVRFGVNL